MADTEEPDPATPADGLTDGPTDPGSGGDARPETGDADLAARIGSIHPRLEMHGPDVGHLGDRRLPALGTLPYAGRPDPEASSGRSRLMPVVAVVAAGGIAATGIVVWSVAAGTGPAGEDRSDSELVAPAGAEPAPGATTTPGTATPADTAPTTTSAVPPVPDATVPDTPVAPPEAPPDPDPTPPPASTAWMEPEAWFTGGRLVLVGALPDQRVADALRRKAATIVGAGAVVDTFTIDPAAPVPAGLPVVVAERVQFDFDSSEVSAAQVALVEAWKAILDANPGVKMHITGYTDSTGPMAYNLELSRERAQAVAGWMQARGVSADRFAVDGRGPADPAADNATVDGRASNRRIQVTLDGLLMT